MKKRLQGFIIGIIITGSVGALAAQYTATDNPFPITYNGNRVWLQGYNIDGSTYFKLRDIADVVGGFRVEFENNTITLTGNSNSAVINSSIDKSNNTANNKIDIKYDTSFKIDKYYSSGRWWRTTNVDSFKITNIEKSVLGELKISYEITGVVTGDDSLGIYAKCYDKDGYVIDSALIYGKVVDGQKFKIKNSTFIPPETVRLEFADD